MLGRDGPEWRKTPRPPPVRRRFSRPRLSLTAPPISTPPKCYHINADRHEHTCGNPNTSTVQIVLASSCYPVIAARDVKKSMAWSSDLDVEGGQLAGDRQRLGGLLSGSRPRLLRDACRRSSTARTPRRGHSRGRRQGQGPACGASSSRRRGGRRREPSRPRRRRRDHRLDVDHLPAQRHAGGNGSPSRSREK